MTPLKHILADGGDFINILVVLVVIGLSLVAKVMEKKKREEDQRRQEEEFRSHRKYRPLPNQKQDSAYAERETTPSNFILIEEDEEEGEEYEPRSSESTLIAPPLPSERPTPVFHQEASPLELSLRAARQEVHQLQAQLQHLHAQHSHLKTAHEKLKQSSISARPREEKPRDRQPAHPVNVICPYEGNLSDPEMLRAAMIYHEIFSPPKALRTEKELWSF